METLNTLRSCSAIPLNVAFTNQAEKDKFTIEQVKDNRSHQLKRSVEIDNLEININVTKYHAEGESLIMYLLGEEGLCFRKPFYIGKDSTIHSFIPDGEDLDFFSDRKFDKIGFITNNNEVVFSFEVNEYSEEERGGFLDLR